jgi:rhodanese-related sulfurtransferase/peroxiredoxin
MTGASMAGLSAVTNLVSWRPLSAGTPAPELSLTADDGTWIRLPDFVGHVNVVLLFFRRQDAETDAWLRAAQADKARFDALSTVVFGVNTRRPDKLRAHRAALGLDFPLLYDPLAVDARAFHASSRWRPVVKDAAVVIGKDGKVAHAARGRAEVGALLAELERLEGVEAAAEADTGGVADIDSTGAVALLEGDGGYVLVDVRTRSEYEADHAPWAVHIPVDELPQRYAELGQTARVICVCQAGARSAAAAEFLLSIGATEVYNVVGGMSGWSGPRVTGGIAQ